MTILKNLLNVLNDESLITIEEKATKYTFDNIEHFKKSALYNTCEFYVVDDVKFDEEYGILITIVSPKETINSIYGKSAIFINLLKDNFQKLFISNDIEGIKKIAEYRIKAEAFDVVYDYFNLSIESINSKFKDLFIGGIDFILTDNYTKILSPDVINGYNLEQVENAIKLCSGDLFINDDIEIETMEGE